MDGVCVTVRTRTCPANERRTQPSPVTVWNAAQITARPRGQQSAQRISTETRLVLLPCAQGEPKTRAGAARALDRRPWPARPPLQSAAQSVDRSPSAPRLPKLASAEPPTAGPSSGGRSMARALESYSSAKDVAYRFAPCCFMVCLLLLGSGTKPKDSFARGADHLVL
jgi:hypothetical protein